MLAELGCGEIIDLESLDNRVGRQFAALEGEEDAG